MTAYYPQSRGNPYEKMLYTSASKQQITAIPTDDLTALLESRLADLGNRLIVHVHWTAPILGPAMTPGDARDLGKKFLRQLEALQSRGARLVWTVQTSCRTSAGSPTRKPPFVRSSPTARI